MKIIFWGAGSYAASIWKKIETESKLYTDEYLVFVDNNKKLWGQYFCKRKVIAPKDIHRFEADLIVITSTLYENSIRSQLTDELDIAKEKVLAWWQYSRLCYTNSIYKERYGNIYQNNRTLQNNLEHTVIYTAITGDYDSLKEPLFTGDNLTYVCITNNPNIKSKIWNMEYIKDDQMDNVHLARHIKMNPHLYFPDYEKSIWVDGKYQIMDDLRTYAAQYQKQSNILCFPHPERACICDEVAACILWTDGINKDMVIQVADYLKDGYPLNYGLYETGCMVRIHNDEYVKMLMSRWEDEIVKYSFRDQLSFPYVCWKYKYMPDICNLDINRNQWLLWKAHLSPFECSRN